MGSRSVGELLLRPSSLTRLPLFRPASSTRLIAPSWSSRRTLTSSTPSHSAQPQRRNESTEDGPPQASATEAANPYMDFLPTSDRQPTGNDQVSQSLDQLFARTNNPNFRWRGGRTPPTTGATSSAQGQTKRVFGDNFSPDTGRMKIPKQFDINEMQMPDTLSGVYSMQPTPVPEIPESEMIYPRLNPSYGRKVELDPSRGRDIVRGIKMLSSLCHRNRLKADLNKQRFHERPGLKRKRLKSERWRARFKVGFAEVTSRVRELTRKGW